MAENGFMMIHDPWMVAAGTAGELRDAADTMDKVRDVLLKTYMKRVNVDEETVSNMMSEETWMNAEEALDMGFIDGITDEMKMAASVKHPERFRHTPENAVEKDERPKAEKHRLETYTYIAASLKSQNL
jgi:hypothetical protein